VTETMRQALHAVDVIGRICRRLSDTGDFRGLDRVARMSLPELDVLVQLENGMGT
jgi:hypothetical protein